jgi:hypothetical protein
MHRLLDYSKIVCQLQTPRPYHYHSRSANMNNDILKMMSRPENRFIARISARSPREKTHINLAQSTQQSPGNLAKAMLTIETTMGESAWSSDALCLYIFTARGP